LEIPRKNAKTHLGAAIALYLLYGDGEDGAQVIAGAADREQARICYNIARQMVENSSKLKGVSEVQQRAIWYGKRNSSFKAISHESNTKHGLDISGLIVDELHAHKDRDLLDTLETGMGAREQPLELILTTAGVASRQNPGFQMHEYAQQVKEGHIQDDSFLPVVYGANEEDDWTDEEVWKKANPNLGKGLNLDYFRGEVAKAKSDAAVRERFRRLHLNIWTNSAQSYISKEDWESCTGDTEIEEGSECYVGLDLSSTTDFTAIVCVFPGDVYKVLSYFFIPEDTVDHRVIKDTLRAWNGDGYVEFTEGNVVDYDVVKDRLLWIAEKYHLKQVAYDPYGANRLIPDLHAQSVECVAFRQGWVSMSPAMKETKRLVMSQGLDHGGNPVLSWMNSNLHFKEDEAGNVQPHKGKSRDRIDGMVALFMAVSRAVYDESEAEGEKATNIVWV